jgi:hypothetical protein
MTRDRGDDGDHPISPFAHYLARLIKSQVPFNTRRLKQNQPA